MVWIYDPSAWVGLFTLVVLEIVLGIDNLVFIAILASKLPAKMQDKARYTGLGMALFIRLILISLISWIVPLTQPLFTLFSESFSVRDIILLGGGTFLLYKATHELHEKLEGNEESMSSSKAATHAFWLVVSQIVVLDAIFSLDSVITAVGMCDHVFIMMFAVIIAMGIMVISSKPLTTFVSGHPTLVILCLSFLLMIGFSLIAEGLHIHVPKSYLYAAIGFSILIEIFNQIARKNLCPPFIKGSVLSNITLTRTSLNVLFNLILYVKEAPFNSSVYGISDIPERVRPNPGITVHLLLSLDRALE